MSPNSVEPYNVGASESGMENKVQGLPGQVENNLATDNNYYLKVVQSSLSLLAHTLIGFVVGVTLIFLFRAGTPLGPIAQHILLCVLGFQLLMSQAILSISDNSWSSNLKFIDKRRAHWILHTLGSGLALAGCFIMISAKDVHWDTIHGKWALVAMVFTTVSLVNGVASLYAYEWRKYMPGNISKISHICFGIVAYVASCICLCFGFDKPTFTEWATQPFTYTTIALSGAFTLIVIINPSFTFVVKTKRFVTSK